MKIHADKVEGSRCQSGRGNGEPVLHGIESLGNDEKLREFDGLWLDNIMNVLNVTDSLDS